MPCKFIDYKDFSIDFFVQNKKKYGKLTRKEKLSGSSWISHNFIDSLKGFRNFLAWNPVHLCNCFCWPTTWWPSVCLSHSPTEWQAATHSPWLTYFTWPKTDIDKLNDMAGKKDVSVATWWHDNVAAVGGVMWLLKKTSHNHLKAREYCCCCRCCCGSMLSLLTKMIITEIG